MDETVNMDIDSSAPVEATRAMPSDSSSDSVVASALEANEAHRAALNAKRAQLKSQLEDMAVLMQSVERDVDPNIEEVRPYELEEWAVFAAPGASTMRPLLTTSKLNAEDSPFLSAIDRRRQYIARTTFHPFTVKEKETLRHCIVSENRRLVALDLHERNQLDSLDVVSQQPDSRFEKNTDGLDWERIAANMRDGLKSGQMRRSAQECKVQWIGSDHPTLLNPAIWTVEEDKQLMELVGDGDVRAGAVNWTDIARGFNGTRIAAHCLMRWMALDQANNPGIEQPWTSEEDEELKIAVEEHGLGNWTAISLALYNTRTPIACHHRYTQTLVPDLKRGPWTQAEDDKLREAVRLHGSKWSRMQEMLPGRTPAQCRERYVRVLSQPVLKGGNWEEAEDNRLRIAVAELGLGNWSAVANQVETRNALQCRKRWPRIAAEDDAASPVTSKPSKTIVEAKNITQNDVDSMTPAAPSSSTPAPPKKRGRPKKQPIEPSDSDGSDKGEGQMDTSASEQPQEEPPAEAEEDTSLRRSTRLRTGSAKRNPASTTTTKAQPKPKPRYSGNTAKTVGSSGESLGVEAEAEVVTEAVAN
ncbi:hypothetical protein DL93DRAFT_2163024 [Clavulina sp. PMI_390]|nr:hypothetical protein DL93DRAFT_2163024 [Clavulina sp. PMI_390]